MRREETDDGEGAGEAWLAGRSRTTSGHAACVMSLRLRICDERTGIRDHENGLDTWLAVAKIPMVAVEVVTAGRVVIPTAQLAESMLQFNAGEIR